MVGASESIYEGKVKSVEDLGDGTAIMHFRNDITAGDGVKHEMLEGKGAINCKTTAMIFEKLEAAGIPTHFIKQLDSNKLLVKSLKILPVEVVVRNIAAGSFCRRYGVQQGTTFDKPLVEFFLKDDALHDPLIMKSTILNLGLASKLEISWMESFALRVNEVLRDFFRKAGMLLVDFKIEIGKDFEGNLFVADEISGDSMRVWDVETLEILDKDRFRKDLGNVIESYTEIYDRLNNVVFNPSSQPMALQIEIMPKADVPNPAGDVVKRAIVNMGLTATEAVSVGKSILITLTNEMAEKNWLKKVNEICKNFLANPLIEDFSIEVQ